LAAVFLGAAFFLGAVGRRREGGREGGFRDGHMVRRREGRARYL